MAKMLADNDYIVELVSNSLNSNANHLSWHGKLSSLTLLLQMIVHNLFMFMLFFFQSLADNKLGSLGGFHMAKMMHLNNCIRKLNISGNEFGNTEAEHFAEAIEVG